MSRWLLLFVTAALLFAADVTPPQLQEPRAEPKYTQEARDAKIEGRVVMEITIDVEGVVSHVKVLEGLGYGLDETAMDAVMQWRFKPATSEGKAVTVKARVECNFRLT